MPGQVRDNGSKPVNAGLMEGRQNASDTPTGVPRREYARVGAGVGIRFRIAVAAVGGAAAGVAGRATGGVAVRCMHGPVAAGCNGGLKSRAAPLGAQGPEAAADARRSITGQHPSHVRGAEKDAVAGDGGNGPPGRGLAGGDAAGRRKTAAPNAADARKEVQAPPAPRSGKGTRTRGPPLGRGRGCRRTYRRAGAGDRSVVHKGTGRRKQRAGKQATK